MQAFWELFCNNSVEINRYPFWEWVGSAQSWVFDLFSNRGVEIMAASTSCLIVSGTDLGIPQVELAKNTGIPGNTMPGNGVRQRFECHQT